MRVEGQGLIQFHFEWRYVNIFLPLWGSRTNCKLNPDISSLYKVAYLHIQETQHSISIYFSHLFAHSMNVTLWSPTERFSWKGELMIESPGWSVFMGLPVGRPLSHYTQSFEPLNHKNMLLFNVMFCWCEGMNYWFVHALKKCSWQRPGSVLTRVQPVIQFFQLQFIGFFNTNASHLTLLRLPTVFGDLHFVGMNQRWTFTILSHWQTVRIRKQAIAGINVSMVM